VAATFAWRGGTGAQGSLTARYVSRQFEDDLNTLALRGAFTLDAAALLPLGRKVAIEARIENLTGALVEATNSDGIIERATPRTFWIGLRFGRLP
jgi:iron complex outermembrane receptor protein